MLCLIGKSDKLQQFRNTLHALGFRLPCDLQRQSDVLLNGFCRQQIEVLENHADATTHRLQAVFRECRNFAAFDLD